MIEDYRDLEPIPEHGNDFIADVSSTSLPLKIERIIAIVAQRWGGDYPGSTVGILGQDAIEICKQYGIDWENYH